ncbi:PP2C family protein-serine/threonine phosphatase [Marinospirillum sp. MEB164]|uniref:PP2C family protein-serine/threonine phosphatase n=1 Tax=Marinospirillum alkalitolerans TaxID=3123374 RepID=A0ABW8PZ58_9GAMM
MNRMEQIARLEQENIDLKTELGLLRQDQEAGYLVQQRLLPANGTCHLGLQLHYWMRPSLYLSGDFIDFWALDQQRVMFYLADVSGHGASSAFVTILLKYLINRYALEDQASPARLCARINRELIQSGLEKHMTLVLGCLDTAKGQLTYTNAAHLPPPLLLEAGQARPLAGRDQPVGLFPEAEYHEQLCDWTPASRLCLATDGILEVLPGKGLEARQEEWFRRIEQAEGELVTLLDALPGSADDWPDDVTLMTVSAQPNANR